MDIREGRYDTNTIEGSPLQKGGCAVEFKGKNNRLVFAEGVELSNATFHFNGSNSVIELGRGVRIHRGAAFLTKDGCTISFGESTNVSSASRFHAEGSTKILVGKECLFANVRFRTTDLHGIFSIETDERLNPPADIVIEDHVWLAEDVYVYKGVRIGAGSAVGGRSTVAGDLPPSSLCVGSPARAVRTGIYWRH